MTILYNLSISVITFLLAVDTLLATDVTAAAESSNLLTLSNSRHLQQTMENVNNAVCGDTEYFCGENDVVIDMAYSALAGQNCSLNSGTVYHSKVRMTPAKSYRSFRRIKQIGTL